MELVVCTSVFLRSRHLYLIKTCMHLCSMEEQHPIMQSGA